MRVDALSKLGGVDCVHQRALGGCSIYGDRPQICGAYRCLWLRGALEESDRPDRLGAVLDVQPLGTAFRLEVREATPGAFDRSARLREIAARYRETMSVRISNVADVMNPDAPYRVLSPDGLERRVAGDRVEVLRDGEPVESRRLPWLERSLRRVVLRFRAWRIRGYAKEQQRAPERQP